MEKIWNLNDNGISFGIKPINKNMEYDEGEEIHLSYGERANSFLIVEYGFALRHNRYDFVRIKGIDYELIKNIAKTLNKEELIENKEAFD